MLTVSYGNPTDPQEKTYTTADQAIKFARSQPWGVIVHQETGRRVCWLAGRWYTNLSAKDQVKNPKKFLML